MIKKHTRLKVRRRIRTRKRQVVDISDSANKQLERHVFRRWHNLKSAWRFALGWVLLLSILLVAIGFQTRALGRYYLSPSPINGGVYTEGLVGNFSNSNPIYATNLVDSSVSRLLFSPLLTYNQKNQLTGDLAESWQVDAKATTYTVKLKPDLKWHDGQPLTADDVVFTYKTIQNPDAKSPLLSSWTGIGIEKVDDRTVKFILPGAYSSFLYSLTTGILPVHILGKNTAPQLRSSAFNTKTPVGSGPFVWQGATINVDSNKNQTETIQFKQFSDFHGGAPKLDGITVRTYATDESLKKAVASKEVIAASGLSLRDNEVNNYDKTSYNLMTANMLFLNNSSPVLSDVKVRQALTKATNTGLLIEQIGYQAVPVREPLLAGQIGYNPAYFQAPYNKAEAMALLDAAGWALPADKQVREKQGKQLKVNLTYENSAEFSRVANTLQKQWAEVGVDLVIVASNDENSGQKFVENHDYDVLLYGIGIGPDPDVYAYWHSSQFSKNNLIRLNLSEYKSATADSALEAGRTRLDPQLRAAKYKPFLEAWKADAPAIGLYQPRYLSISNQTIFGAANQTINVPSDRFNNVQNWMINTERSLKQ